MNGKKIFRVLIDLLKFSIDILFPRQCLNCRKMGVKDVLCSDCVPKSVKPQKFAEDTYFLYPYNNVYKKIIHEYKFNRNKALADTYLKPLLRQAIYDNYDVVVLVPSHWMRIFQRGFNHLKRLFNDFNFGDYVYRKKYTPYLYKLDRDSRIKAIRDSFALKNKEIFYNKNVLIVDDILTSGATFSELKKLFTEEGNAAKVDGFFICKS